MVKLATFSYRDEPPRVGVVVQEGLVSIEGDTRTPSSPVQLIQIIRERKNSLEWIRDKIKGGTRVPLSSVRLLAPIPQPPEFLVVGANYADHVAEAGLPLPKEPIFTNKQTSSIVGPYDNVVLPRVSEQLDYEGELGIVVGHAKRNLNRQEAAAAIFGYVVVNDLSVRDWQLRSTTHTIGKSFDTHGPFGPWIVTAEQITDPHNLTITTTVNGQVRQHGSTAGMIADCYDILVLLSRSMTLQPGTVITTGTPAGVGFFQRPPAWLRVGDEVSVEISSVGRIANHVVAEPD